MKKMFLWTFVSNFKPWSEIFWNHIYIFLLFLPLFCLILTFFPNTILIGLILDLQVKLYLHIDQILHVISNNITLYKCMQINIEAQYTFIGKFICICRIIIINSCVRSPSVGVWMREIIFVHVRLGHVKLALLSAWILELFLFIVFYSYNDGSPYFKMHTRS